MATRSQIKKSRVASFLDNELWFYADPIWQREVWENGGEEDFWYPFNLLAARWDEFYENRAALPISNKHYLLLDALFEKIRNYYAFRHNPTKPSEYERVLIDPEWVEIQKDTKRVYEQIAPLIGARRS